MKSLYVYLNEDREVLKNLPFDLDLFTKFMQDAIINMNYDDSDYWEPVKDLVTAHDPHIWNIFYSYCESYFEIQSTTSIEEFYNALKNIPLDRYKRVIGAGSSGVILSFKDKVIKIFHGARIKTNELPFFEWCLKHKSKVFPRVYKIGKNWCTMEKLKTGTPKCIMYMDIINNFPIKNFSLYSDISKGNVLSDTSKLTKEQLEVYNWCLEVKREMDDMKSKYIKYPGDLALNNIGERDNGEVVFFDV